MKELMTQFQGCQALAALRPLAALRGSLDPAQYPERARIRRNFNVRTGTTQFEALYDRPENHTDFPRNAPSQR